MSDFDAEREWARLDRAATPDRGLASILGMKFVEVAEGTVVCELTVREEHLNAHGVVHGGIVSALTDHALGGACVQLVRDDGWAATTEFKLNLVAPAGLGTMVARSRVVARTRRLAVVGVEIESGGRLIGVAQGTVSLTSREE